MKDYTKEEINEAINGEKEQFTNLKNRINKWKSVLREVHDSLKYANEGLRYLDEEFNKFFRAMDKIGETNESLEGQKRE